MLDCDGVALVQVTAQFKVFVDGVPEVALAHLTQVLRKIIDNQAVLIREELGTHLRNFPSRNVGMEAVEERGINHGLGERSQ